MLSLLLLSALTAAEGAVYRVHDYATFVEWKDKVNNGDEFRGTTVILENDIDLNNKPLEPIGTNANTGFYGTFDGQGYTIKNLYVNTTYANGGLVTYNHGTTFKNVVFDSSSTFAGWESTDRIGSAFGYCSAEIGVCRAENIVNMANIQYFGSSWSVILGGIAGGIDGSIHGAVVRNCVNFGTVVNAAELITYVYMGGIVGDANGFYGDLGKRTYIQNCLNLGILAEADGSSSWYTRMGGIVGSASNYVVIDNCVNDGALITNMTSLHPWIGSIVGAALGAKDIPIVVSHCFWSEEIAQNAVNYTTDLVEVVESYPFNGEYEFANNATLPTGFESTNLVESLNAAAEYYTLREYSRWVLNKDMHTMEFKVSDAVLIVTSDLILLPTPPRDGTKWFKEWYTDDAFKQPFVAQEITENTNLYGHMTENTNEYTITFDVDGGSPKLEPIKARFGSLAVVPMTPVKDNKYSIDYWATEYGDKVDQFHIMTAHDITLHPVWKYNRFSTVDEFLEFAANVSNGTTYEGETIYLSADLDFGGMSIEPLSPYKAHFRGTFDGLNHVISNLKVNSSSSYVGLFAYTRGMTLRNLEIAPSCEFVSHGTKEFVAVAAFIAWCDGTCYVSNCVSHANVYYGTDNSGNSVQMGGISGAVQAVSEIVNCTNYGKIEHNGNAYSSYMGGIVGYTYGNPKIIVRNCDNRGDVIRAGDTERYTDIDGIVGYKCDSLNIENCKNYGKIKGAASSIYLSVALLFFIALMF